MIPQAPNQNLGLEGVLTEILKAVNNLTQTIEERFPLASATTATTFTNGTTGAMPTQFEAFLIVTISGVTYKIPMVKP
jgi:hypothetical protein